MQTCNGVNCPPDTPDTRLAFALLLWGALAGSSALAGPTELGAQVTGPGPDGRWPLQPNAPGNRVLAPFMEGWYANEDGTFSISFGYLNANQDALEIPIGADNFIEPAQFDGMQPTTFLPGHHRGVFTANLPAAMRDTDVWWTIRKPNGEETKVPGRIGASAYQLDWYPRPHGTVPPRVSFDSDPGEGRGPPGIVAQRTLPVAAGSPLTVSINARDISERDPEDFRTAEALPLRVVWSKYRGPGQVEFTRHESTSLPEAEEDAADGGDDDEAASGPEIVLLPEGFGTARVVATFSEPGDYLLLAQVDNWSAPDSSSGNQCCWTNGYVRVSVR